MTPGSDSPPKPTRLLVVEDDREMQYLFSVLLTGDDREVLVVGTGAEAEDVLEHQPIDLVILDLILPDTDGRTLLSRMRKHRGTAQTPVVCVTSRVAPEIRADCFARGADAFVEKPFDPDQLRADVSVTLERAAARERQVHQDDLTGLLNRAGFLDHLGEVGNSDYGLVALELDGIRRISDRWGWGTGERVTFEAAAAISTALPEGGVLARWGGGQFALTVPNRPNAAAEQILDALRNHPIEGPDGETFRVTASAGAALVRAGEAPEAAMDVVQGRLFQANDRGGNQLIHGLEEAPEGTEARHILVAEDDEITATILKHRLKKEGFDVAHHSNGRDAYEAALEATAAMVILDVKMPGMDGFEVLERLRKTPAYAGVPIVILSSMGSEADVVRGFELGADDYMLKPFSPAELIARARRLLARGRPSAGR